ncbi:MAG TPA: transferrin receptor-like dimerization domain-containing protein [Gemmatimonadales bacterium]|nr:transferrin receptor-like dimerization domain-containing protein [Gemmatimonadales bacterium]
MLRALCAFALLAPLPLQAQQQAPIRGFPNDQLELQARREAQARAVPNRDTLRTLVRSLAAVPHEAGTDRSRHVAELLLARFRAMGLNARIEQFEALMPRPVTRTLELLGPEPFTASLREPALTQDPTTGQADQLPTFNAYSPDGDVTAELVYVNYGRPEDYRVLDSLGISVKGKIVIARYGQSWRGIKPKVAAEHGAVGCLIYSDPRDDGYYVDDVYPSGPMRPASGVQRGSVMDMPTYPGDPLSPGWASIAGGRRLPLAEAATLEKIPVLPIGYGDALPLLRTLAGPVAPESWRGALPITYHIGPGTAQAHLALSFEWRNRPLYDVIATIPGAVWPDQWVIYGNHHDAWVNGAEDPISGQAALGETARAVASLLKTGWRPARTIVFAAWDGEEWGLLGSTEWAEAHADELRTKAVAYYNSDTNDAGWIETAGSHALEQFISEVARDVTDPLTGKSALQARLDHQRAQRAQRDTSRDTTFTLGALGSGSDYTAFVDHLGVPSVDVRYGGAAHRGIYHSIYDSYTFYERFLDTGYVYGATEARTMATAILRMADAPLLPFEFGAPARTYRRYADDIARLAARNDTTRGLDLSAVRTALDRLDTAAVAYERARAAFDTARGRDTARRRTALGAVNRLLAASEQALTDSTGLPRRPWFRHLVYAPGFYTGYGVKTMPGIREAVEQRNPAEAQAEAARVAAALSRYADLVHRAADALSVALR